MISKSVDSFVLCAFGFPMAFLRSSQMEKNGLAVGPAPDFSWLKFRVFFFL